MKYPFKRELESGLIIVSIEIDGKYELKMVLDTGASNTTIDNNFSDYNGLLGLDFFEGTNFCIDMKLNTITLTK
ncbi:MAG: aspartyl protease family protein [Bacteroidia bacterium]|nr:aspartyl protease family protein [Bacteroidia bacterium]